MAGQMPQDIVRPIGAWCVLQLLRDRQTLLPKRVRPVVVALLKGHMRQIVERTGDAVPVPQIPLNCQTLFQERTSLNRLGLTDA